MDQSPPPSSSPIDRLGPRLGAFAAVACALWFGLGTGGGWPLDDAWIHQQLARGMAQGDGLVLRPSAWAPISTAPLWTALLTLGQLVPALSTVWGRVLGVGCLVGALPAVDRLGRAAGLAPIWAGIAAFLVGATGWLVWGALSGLEVTLFTLLSLWGLERFVREARDGRVPMSFVLFALAALARPEGWLLVALAVAWRLSDLRRRDGRRTLLLGLLGIAVVVAPTLAFYLVAGGSPLPQTLAAKTNGLRSPLPDPSYLISAVRVFFRSNPGLALLAPIGALGLAVSAVLRRRPVGLAAVWFLALPAALSTLDPAGGRLLGNFGRYLFPLLPLMVVLGLWAVAPVTRWELAGARRSRGALRLSVAASVALLLLALSVPATVRARSLYRTAVANVETSDVATARWLGSRLDRRALLAVHDLGAFSYFLPNPILDLAGIASPEVRPALRAEDWQRRLAGVLEERRPDYLAVFPRYLPFVERDPRFSKVHELTLAHNVAMGADRVAVFSTPWTRYPLHRPEEVR